MQTASVHAKAKSFVEALAHLLRGGQEVAPRGHLARDYNTLRSLALEAEPGLDRRLLGPEVPVRVAGSGEEVCDAGFVEIEIYARQVLGQLALLLAAAGA